jgi:porin
MSAQSLHGRGINDTRVGAAQVLSNLEEQRFGKLLEVWYADSWREGLLTIKAGRQYSDADFGVVENGADFLNSSYGLNPTTPMPTYPHPEPGVSAWVAPAPWIAWGVGVFRGGSPEPLSEGGMAVERRPFTILETKIEPFGKEAASHGTYRVGVWRQSRAAWLTRGGESVPAGNYGFYATADHWFGRSRSGESSGPGLFFQVGRTPSDRNEITGYLGGGVAWAGMVPARRRDSAGIALAHAKLAGRRSENILEVFYKCRLTSKLMVQPDLQWALHPSGVERNALVAGLRVGLEF